MRISDWSSDVCSSDLRFISRRPLVTVSRIRPLNPLSTAIRTRPVQRIAVGTRGTRPVSKKVMNSGTDRITRSEEHTSELQSLMRISYAVLCLKKKTTICHNKYTIKLTPYTHK